MNQITCSNCGYPVSNDASFCPDCGKRLQKFCANCGKANAPYLKNCEHCMHTEFSASRTAYRLHPSRRGRDQVKREAGQGADIVHLETLSTQRVLVLSVLSGGLYFIWWMYKSWAQLSELTIWNRFPVWHALTQGVPIYGLFRLHDHMTEIRDFATDADVETSLNPTAAVVLYAALWIISIGTAILTVSAFGSVLIILIQMVVSTAITVRAQQTFNAYLLTTDSLAEEAPYGTGEVIIVIVGLLSVIINLSTL